MFFSLGSYVCSTHIILPVRVGHTNTLWHILFNIVLMWCTRIRQKKNEIKIKQNAKVFCTPNWLILSKYYSWRILFSFELPRHYVRIINDLSRITTPGYVKLAECI